MTTQNSTTFGPANVKAKLTSHLARLIRRHRLGYAAFEAICKAARKGNRPAATGPFTAPAPAAARDEPAAVL